MQTSAVRILAEIESHAKGERWATSLFYGDFEAVKEKIERLYHSEEAALILGYMEKLTGGCGMTDYSYDYQVDNEIKELRTITTWKASSTGVNPSPKP